MQKEKVNFLKSSVDSLIKCNKTESISEQLTAFRNALISQKFEKWKKKLSIFLKSQCSLLSNLMTVKQLTSN